MIEVACSWLGVGTATKQRSEMALNEVIMYQAKCDRCGRVEDDYGDFAALVDAGDARELALDTNDWVEIGDRLLCSPGCWQWSEDEDEMIERPPVAGQGKAEPK